MNFHLKNIKIADQEQSRIFKDALDNYIKVDKEQNKILKDALIKEGVIKGDNFFMDKADPSKAKSDLNVKISVSNYTIHDIMSAREGRHFSY